MSAWVCGNDTFDLLVTAALHYEARTYHRDSDTGTSVVEKASEQDPTMLGRRLLEANVGAVLYRYSGTATKTDEAEYAAQVLGYTFQPVVWPAESPVDFNLQVIQSANCLGYQACESPTWSSTMAYAFLQSVREEAIKAIDGMDDTHWEWTRALAGRTSSEEHERIRREMRARRSA